METKINHSWLLIYDDLSDFFEDSTAQCKFSSFDWSGVSGSSQATLLFFCRRYGSAGFRSNPHQPTVSLCSPHQRTALLRLVMSNQSPRSTLPLLPSLQSAYPM